VVIEEEGLVEEIGEVMLTVLDSVGRGRWRGRWWWWWWRRPGDRDRSR
jgi:hypothetical protein